MPMRQRHLAFPDQSLRPKRMPSVGDCSIRKVIIGLARMSGCVGHQYKGYCRLPKVICNPDSHKIPQIAYTDHCSGTIFPWVRHTLSMVCNGVRVNVTNRSEIHSNRAAAYHQRSVDAYACHYERMPLTLKTKAQHCGVQMVESTAATRLLRRMTFVSIMLVKDHLSIR